jgi:hypothetical protein
MIQISQGLVNVFFNQVASLCSTSENAALFRIQLSRFLQVKMTKEGNLLQDHYNVFFI